MLEQLNEILTALKNEETVWENIAKIHAKTRDSLIRQGFTREEAIAIICAQSSVIPGVKGN